MYHSDHNYVMLLNCTSQRKKKRNMTISDNLKQWMMMGGHVTCTQLHTGGS